MAATKLGDGRWRGEVLGLPEASAEGATRREALRLAHQLAIRVCSERFERGETVPEALGFLLVDMRFRFVSVWENGRLVCRREGPPLPH